MQKHNGTLIRKFDSETEGNASVGTSVVVRKVSDNSIATIYDIDSTSSLPKNNPFVTDNFGRYSFYAPNGKYLLVFGDGSDEVTIVLVDNLAHSGLILDSGHPSTQITVDNYSDLQVNLDALQSEIDNNTRSFLWDTPITTSTNISPSQPRQVLATTVAVDITLDTFSIGDIFKLHNSNQSSNVVRIMNTSYTITGQGDVAVGGENVIVGSGDTVYLVAQSLTQLEIV